MKKRNNQSFYKKKSRRPLSQKQKELIQLGLEKYIFKKSDNRLKNVFLEIGFGYGENIIKLAKNNKDKLILGCEVYLPGIASLIEKIRKNKINNVAIYVEDVFSLFDKIKKSSIEKIFLLFPDPWPKKKHHKRRLVSRNLLESFNKILIPSGEIYVATDSVEYLKVILEKFFDNKNFFWEISNPKEFFLRPSILTLTKYERKAEILKNKKFFLKFKKIS